MTSVLTFDQPLSLVVSGPLAFDSFSATDIWLSPSMGDISSVWKSLTFDLFEVTNGTTSWQWYMDDFISFTGGRTHAGSVMWANNSYPPSGGTYTLNCYSTTKKPMFNKTLCTIGDSITWKWYGTYLRTLLRENGLQYDFTGNHMDRFGFQHSAEGGDTTQTVLNRIVSIPDANCYFILLGYNDNYTNPQWTVNNILRIQQQLKSRDIGNRVYVSTLLPATTAHDIYNTSVNTILATTPNINLIDLGGWFRSQTGWESMLTDGIHPTLAGYQLIAPWLAGQIL